jgi:non-specific serine/threonine protein kinase
LVEDPRQAAASLEGLAWIAAEKGDPRRAAVLMAAAEALGRMAGAPAVALPHLLVFHEECELRAREALGTKQFEAACQQGRSFNLDDAIAYALGTAS